MRDSSSLHLCLKTLSLPGVPAVKVEMEGSKVPLRAMSRSLGGCLNNVAQPLVPLTPEWSSFGSSVIHRADSMTPEKFIRVYSEKCGLAGYAKYCAAYSSLQPRGHQASRSCHQSLLLRPAHPNNPPGTGSSERHHGAEADSQGTE